MRNKQISFVFSILLIFFGFYDCRNLRVKHFVMLHEWTYLEFGLDNQSKVNIGKETQFSNKGNGVPVDLDIEYGDEGSHRTFLCIPRLNFGIPYSLAIVATENNLVLKNPKLSPYPSYDWHSSGGSNCSEITSAMRTYIDDCWRLWIIDSGQVNSKQICAPKILAFDLVTDTLVHQFVLPQTLYKPGISVFTDMAVDIQESIKGDQCEKTMIYISDPWGFGLIVYDVALNKAWRIEHPLMEPDPDLRKQNFANDGIFSVSLTTKKATQEERFIYFHSLNSYIEVRVPLGVINNSSLWLGSTGSTEYVNKEFQVLGNRSTQCEAETIDNFGNMYCSLISINAIVRWDSISNYSADDLKVVAYNPAQFKFVTSLKISQNARNEDELWALSVEPGVFAAESFKSDKIKFQIIGCSINDMSVNGHCSVGVSNLRRNKLI